MTPDLVIRNIDILNPGVEPGRGVLRFERSQAIAISGSTIASVGPDVDAPRAADEIDGTGKLAIPGLVNCHTHAFQVLCRGRGDGLPLSDWVRDAVWDVASDLTDESLATGVELACIESLEAGVTTVVDGYYLGGPASRAAAVADASLRTGIRASIARVAIDSELAPDGVRQTPAVALEQAAELVDRWHGRGGLISIRLEAMNEVLTSEALIRATHRLALRSGVGFGMHIAETRDRAEATLRSTGQTSVAWLGRLGVLGPSTLLSHCVWVSDEEVAMLARTGTAVAHNPTSNAFLADGIAPLGAMLRAGVVVGLGTDGAASNNSLGILEVAKWAVLLQRVRSLDAGVMRASHAFELASLGGARALGMDDQIGSIDPGKHADVVILDSSQPAFAPNWDVAASLVYSPSSCPVTTVLVGGRRVVDGGVALTVDRMATVGQAATWRASAATPTRESQQRRK